MNLRLELRMPRHQLSLGSEVALELELKNLDEGPVEVASLFNNNTITNYMLSDAQDRFIARVNHVTRQLLFEKTEPRTWEEQLHSLAGGASELRQDNFARYHWLGEPGVYHLRGLYSWRGVEVVSEPLRFEVLAAPLFSLDTVWSYHYGEKSLLHSTWVTDANAGAHECVLRQSAHHRPQVIDYNPVLLRPHTPIYPRIAFRRSLLAGPEVWLAWVEGQQIACLLTSEGHSVAGPFRLAGSGAQPTLPLTPLSNPDGSLTLFCRDAASPSDLAWIRVGADGRELGRSVLSLPGGASLLRGVCEEDGGYRLLWFLPASGELQIRALDVEQGAFRGASEVFGRVASAPAALLVPPVLGSEGYVVSVAIAAEGALTLCWWSVFDTTGARVVKTERIDVPEAAQILDVSGELNAKATPYILVRSLRLLRYVNGSLLQTLELLKDGELDPAGTERLLINPRNDVFLIANRPGFGLSERLIHRGSDYDLSVLEA